MEFSNLKLLVSAVIFAYGVLALGIGMLIGGRINVALNSALILKLADTVQFMLIAFWTCWIINRFFMHG